MAGNQGRRGAMRRGEKSGSERGSGAKKRRSLRGKGPTPKAEDREYHAAYRAKKRREAEAAKQERREASRPKSKIRMRENRELVFGRHAVSEVVEAGLHIERIFVTGTALSDSRISDVVRHAGRNGAAIVEVSRRDLDLVAEGTAHQGLAVEVPEFQYVGLEEIFEGASRRSEVPLIVALDGITDPHNLGAVLRSGAAFGVSGLLLPTRRSAGVTAAAWKVSAGAAARVPVAREVNLVRALKQAKEAGCFVVGLDGDGSVSIGDLPVVREPLVLVMGAEGAGLSRLVKETCDQIVAIPISGAVESLNVAVAAGIALYEVARQRG